MLSDALLVNKRRAVGGIIYAIGGSGYNLCLGKVEAYDPSTNIWTSMTDMPTKRFWHSSAVANGKIFVTGGQSLSNVTLDTLEVFTP